MKSEEIPPQKKLEDEIAMPFEVPHPGKDTDHIYEIGRASNLSSSQDNKSYGEQIVNSPTTSNDKEGDSGQKEDNLSSEDKNESIKQLTSEEKEKIQKMIGAHEEEQEEEEEEEQNVDDYLNNLENDSD